LPRNCLLKRVIEGKTQERVKLTGRGERRRKQLPYDLNESEDIGNGKRKHKISLSGKLALEDAWTCRKTRVEHEVVHLILAQMGLI